MKSTNESISVSRNTVSLFLGSIALLSIVGCGSGTVTVDPGPGGTGPLAISTNTGISVENASLEQCPGSGKVYSIYIDINRNGVKDADEDALSSQVVCNGVTGKSSLISSQRVEIYGCSSGSGLQIQIGLDANSNFELEAGEISKTEILCDGRNGQQGAAGPAGSNGHSIVFQSVAASLEVCPSGGVTTIMALDVLDQGSYNVNLPNQYSMTICHGRNGQDGQNGQNGQNAQLSPYTPVDIIIPCASTAAYKEVLFRFYNGQVFASFSDNASGLNTRFTIVPDGSYRTTDGNNCSFSLSTSGQTRSISWFDQIQQSWQLQ